MVKIVLDPFGMAALGTVLATSTVSSDRRGTFKRIQAEYEKYQVGNQVSGGTIELERADWEWAQAMVVGCNAWNGQILLADGDEKLKAAMHAGLNGGSHEPQPD